jgi:hypothetical protein
MEGFVITAIHLIRVDDPTRPVVTGEQPDVPGKKNPAANAGYLLVVP